MNGVEALCADLEDLVLMKEIPLSELELIKPDLESKDVIDYLEAIIERSKPEESLRQNFFYKGSPIMEFLGVRGSPEVNVGAVTLIWCSKTAWGERSSSNSSASLS